MSTPTTPPATTVTQDPSDWHFLEVAVHGPFGTDEVRIHKADAHRLIAQMQAALAVDYAEDWRERLEGTSGSTLRP